ncbi:hypothetical protein [Croceicoccus gelatinilyticus]|uniref:hypothetical protein n=1 Tax=Croceicoccus gelatinilyticus TaxID=2835536 RepID=UPI001BCD9826|nr:hypothetical protein [Croceicoccus gelatinilyticus]MBS7671060.1 hypothetical protein [Croceicoccus gelatinilyticus]
MVEERYTETRTPAGDTHTHTEIIREEPARSRGGAGWAIVIVLLLAVIIGGFVLMKGNDAEIARDNAIADAANSVGDAAESVGSAADTAAERISE